MTSVHFSSKSNEWPTPRDFYEKYHEKYRFTLDVAATKENALCTRFFTEEDNALIQDWSGEVCWMNPPYGREIKKFMKKAYEESLKGTTIVCLVPSRTDTFWWHEYAMKGEIESIRGRLKFGGYKTSAPFPSAVVVFNGEKYQ